MLFTQANWFSSVLLDTQPLYLGAEANFRFGSSILPALSSLKPFFQTPGFLSQPRFQFLSVFHSTWRQYLTAKVEAMSFAVDTSRKSSGK